MKFLLSTVVLMSCLLLINGCSSTNVKPSIQTDNKGETVVKVDSKEIVEVFYKGKLMGTMTLAEWSEVVKSAENYQAIIDAELSDPKRMEVIFLKKPWVFKKKKGLYKAQIKINWYTKSKKEKVVIKSITLTLLLSLEKTNSIPKWRMIYRDITEWAAPLGWLGFFILLLILL